MRFEVKPLFIVIGIICCTVFNGESQYRMDNHMNLMSSSEAIQEADVEDKRGASFMVSASKSKKLFKNLPFAGIVKKIFTHGRIENDYFPTSTEWLRPNYYTLLFLYSLF